MGERRALGIDIGGTGIKYALVDVGTGDIVGDREHMATPRPATPAALIGAIEQVLQLTEGHEVEAVGIAFPAVIQDGIALTAVNIASEWQYLDVAKTVREATGRDVAVLNDGDAAGLAEVRFGAGRGVAGKVVCVTLGTGVGTSLFLDGMLIPNIELGGLDVRGRPGGERAANSVRKAKKLSWKAWAKDVEAYLRALDEAAWPDLIIIGGGVSKKAHLFLPRIHTRAAVVPAAMRNDAGIVGAAIYATRHSGVHV